MHRAAVLTTLAIALSACGQPAPAPRSDLERRVLAHAELLHADAVREEPPITARLRQLGDEQAGALIKLEHRFKSVPSIERKLRLRLAGRDTGELRPDDVIDGLRYTMVIDDKPLGRYAGAIIAVLRGLEADGHRVMRVKNYWPAGDNYSGVNVVLVVGSGLYWELQFHTAASAAVRDEWHRSYRVLRAPRTSLAERRRIFDEMSKPWLAVPIPRGVLAGEGTLHASEKIIIYPRP